MSTSNNHRKSSLRSNTNKNNDNNTTSTPLTGIELERNIAEETYQINQTNPNNISMKNCHVTIILTTEYPVLQMNLYEIQNSSTTQRFFSFSLLKHEIRTHFQVTRETEQTIIMMLKSS